MSERRTSAPDRRISARGGRRSGDQHGRPTILIIDDHVDSRELLAAVLQETDVNLAEAGTGREALERMRRQPLPSLVLMDLSLPDCHGTEIVRALKANPDTRRIPVFALTASVMAADKTAAAEAGCDGFIEKPVLPDDIVAIVRRVLDRAPL